MRRVLTSTALLSVGLTVVLVVVHPQRADAQQAIGGQQDGSVTAGAGSPGGTETVGGSAPATPGKSGGGGRSHGGSSGPTCTYTKVPWELAVLMGMADSLGVTPALGGPTPEQLAQGGSNITADGSRAYYKRCEGQPGRFVILPPRQAGRGAPPDPLPTPGELAQEAVQQTPLPLPTAEMSPAPPIRQLVNLPVFLWIDSAQWVPQTASASAGGVTSTVTATPSRVVWDMGDGESVTCDAPGTPYVPGVADDLQPSDCQHTYRRSSARAANETFTVTTTMEWGVTWVAVGAPGGGNLGTARRSSTTAVQVAEIQTLNVPAR